MSSARTQRFTARGTLCRRPSVLLLPLTPLVLLVFAAVLFVGTVRAARIRRSAALVVTTDSPALAAAQPTTGIRRGLAAVRPTPRRAFGTAAAVFGGVVVAASMAGGTYAFLNSQASTPAVTVSSGNLAVTVQYGSGAAGATAALPTTAWTAMLPGDIAGQQFTIANGGTATATVTARLSATSAWDIRLVAGTCPTTQLTSTPLTTTAAAYGTIAAGTNSVVCVQATLPAGAPASAEATTVPFTITLDAKQVAP